MNYSARTLVFKAFQDSIPIFLAYFPLAATWGVLWEQSGLALFWVPLFSTFVYAGTIQFIALAFINNPKTFLSLAITIIPIAMRCGFYTTSIYDKLPTNRWIRFICCYGMVDGTYGLLIAQKPEIIRQAAYSGTLALLIHVYWIAGSVAGAYLGTYIPNGFQILDFALPCLIAILAFQQILRLGAVWPAGIALSTGLAAIWLGVSSWLLPSLVISTCIVLMIVKHQEKGAKACP